MTDDEVRLRVDNYWRNRMVEQPKKRRGRVPAGEKLARIMKRIERHHAAIARLEAQDKALRAEIKSAAEAMLAEIGE